MYDTVRIVTVAAGTAGVKALVTLSALFESTLTHISVFAVEVTGPLTVPVFALQFVSGATHTSTLTHYLADCNGLAPYTVSRATRLAGDPIP